MTLEQIIQQHLGALLFENSKLVARIAELQAEVSSLKRLRSEDPPCPSA